jgi:hypothetical protein
LSFPTATASYFALNDRVARRPHELRTARLTVEVVGLSGRLYPAGTEVRILGTEARIDGFVDGDRLSLSRRDFAAAT